MNSQGRLQLTRNEHFGKSVLSHFNSYGNAVWSVWCARQRLLRSCKNFGAYQKSAGKLLIWMFLKSTGC